ncbi:MAG: right-handed parallel beta-helix repeat-containing protein [archaeon]
MKQKALLLGLFLLVINIAFAEISVTDFNDGITPLVGITYYNSTLALNVTTNGLANCTYNISSSDGGNSMLGSLGTNTTNHTSLLNIVPNLNPGYTYNIGVLCYNATNISDYNISSRTVLRDPVCKETVNTTWILGHDLDCDLIDGEFAVALGASGASLNCDGHFLSGNLSGYGVYASTVSGLTIKGCTINYFADGIYLSSVTGSTVQNNTMSHSDGEDASPEYALVYLTSSVSNTVKENRLRNSSKYGVFIELSSSNIVSSNNFTGIYDSVGIVGLSGNSDSNIVRHNTISIWNSSAIGIYLIYDTTNSLVYNNTISVTAGSSVNGIYLYTDDSSMLPNNNNISGNTLTGMYTGVLASAPTNITGLEISQNSIYATTFDVKLVNVSSPAVTRNSFYAANSGYKVSILGQMDLSVNGEGNFWNRTTCPAFVAGTDTNNVAITDNYPFDASDKSSFACDCNDNVAGTLVLYRNVTCSSASDNGLNVTSGSIDCSGFTVKNSASSPTGAGILVSNDSVTISDCDIFGFKSGIESNATVGLMLLNNTIRNSSLSGIEFYMVNDTLVSGNSIYYQPYGLWLKNTTNVTVYQNNIYDFSVFGFTETLSSSLTVSNNYWGHSSCPLFSYMIDTDSVTLDLTPVSTMGDFSSTVNCSLQANSAVFNSMTLYLPNGSSTRNPVLGYSYYYDADNDYQALSSLSYSINGYDISPWKIYNYYYVGDQDIIMDVNITPANYRMTSFNLSTSGFDIYSFDVINTSGANGSRGVYRINISNYAVNMSDPYANGTYGPKILNLNLMVYDNMGAARILWLQALYNFTPSDEYSYLAGETTDWTAIDDFTNVSNLKFQAFSSGINISMFEFLESVNLVDVDFVHALRSLGDYFGMGEDSSSIDSTVMAPLNKTTNITYYGLTTTLNSTELGAKMTIDSSACPASICNNFSYDNDSKTLSFLVEHWTNYSLDRTAPTITASGPSADQSRDKTAVQLYATTNEAATCKYDTSDAAYDSMAYSMNGAGTTHTVYETVSSGNTYTFYVRCKDGVENKMGTSTIISFSVLTTSSGGGGGGGGSVASCAEWSDCINDIQTQVCRSGNTNTTYTKPCDSSSSGVTKQNNSQSGSKNQTSVVEGTIIPGSKNPKSNADAKTGDKPLPKDVTVPFTLAGLIVLAVIIFGLFLIFKKRKKDPETPADKPKHRKKTT